MDFKIPRYRAWKPRTEWSDREERDEAAVAASVKHVPFGSPAWGEWYDVIVKALRSFPEALQSVADAVFAYGEPATSNGVG